MGKQIENNDVAKEFWENLSDATALDAETKTAVLAKIGAVEQSPEDTIPYVQKDNTWSRLIIYSESDLFADRAVVIITVTEGVDSLSIGQINFEYGSVTGNVDFVGSGSDINQTAADIKDALASNGIFAADWSSNVDGNVITLTRTTATFETFVALYQAGDVVTMDNTYTQNVYDGDFVGQMQIVGDSYPFEFFQWDGQAWIDAKFITATSAELLENKIIINPVVRNYGESVVELGSSGAVETIVLTSGTFQIITLTANCAFTMPAITPESKSFVLKVLTGAGGFAATFIGVKWSGSIAPTITPTAGRYDLLSFISDGTAWSGSAIQNFTP